jgi:hypothetical protein
MVKIKSKMIVVKITLTAECGSITKNYVTGFFLYIWLCVCVCVVVIGWSYLLLCRCCSAVCLLCRGFLMWGVLWLVHWYSGHLNSWIRGWNGNLCVEVISGWISNGTAMKWLMCAAKGLQMILLCSKHVVV